MGPSARVSRGRLGLGDGHALTRTIPGARSGGVSERGQEDENQAAERSPETHAAEPQGADWQAGASARVASREEARAPNAGLLQSGESGAHQGMGDVRLSMRSAAGGGAGGGGGGGGGGERDRLVRGGGGGGGGSACERLRISSVARRSQRSCGRFRRRRSTECWLGRSGCAACGGTGIRACTRCCTRRSR